MLIKILDKAAMGDDTPFSPLYELGDVVIYDKTAPEDIKERISDAEVVIVNKVKLSESVLTFATSLRLICTFATGYDNIDVEYCKREGIAVCNVPAYSTQSVSLMTVSTVLALQTKLYEYSSYVASGEYTDSGVANKLTPVYHEIAGKRWGIIGYGNIGRAVAEVARALGAKVSYYQRHATDDAEYADVDTICRECDVITLHCPLNDESKNMIDKRRISLMKDGVIQQMGEPQAVYNNPQNLFVASFLGTPAVNVFDARVENGELYVANERIMSAKGIADGEVTLAVRPEGLVPSDNGVLTLKLQGVEVMGRDVSVLAEGEASRAKTVRAIVGSDVIKSISGDFVKFDIKTEKAYIFNKKTENRLYTEE